LSAIKGDLFLRSGRLVGLFVFWGGEGKFATNPQALQWEETKEKYEVSSGAEDDEDGRTR
jgi:hypothetical protein